MGILHPRNVQQGESDAPKAHTLKQHVKAFNQHEREQGRAVAGSHEQALKRNYASDARIYYIVVMWTEGAKIYGHVLVGLPTRT